MRLDRPIGTWLLLLPAWWAIAMSMGGINYITPTHFYLFALFGLGAIIMRGAGCVINDLWDKDIDKLVERTKARPLASGTVTPKQATLFLGFLLSLGLIILLQLPMIAIFLGLLSLIPVIIYPLAKRITWYPQAVLGITFNFGALIGAATIDGFLSFPALILYIAGFFWTMGYDTIYAHQDINDDNLVGVKSTALKFGVNSINYIFIFYALTSFLIFCAGVMSGATSLFYIFWALASAHLLWQLNTWNMNDPTNCLKKFKSNRDFGLLIFAGFFLQGIF